MFSPACTPGSTSGEWPCPQSPVEWNRRDVRRDGGLPPPRSEATSNNHCDSHRRLSLRERRHCSDSSNPIRPMLPSAPPVAERRKSLPYFGILAPGPPRSDSSNSSNWFQSGVSHTPLEQFSASRLRPHRVCRRFWKCRKPTDLGPVESTSKNRCCTPRFARDGLQSLHRSLSRFGTP